MLLSLLLQERVNVIKLFSHILDHSPLPQSIMIQSVLRVSNMTWVQSCAHVDVSLRAELLEEKLINKMPRDYETNPPKWEG